jgi:hypothetical protein
MTKDGEIVRAKTKTYFPPDPKSMIMWLTNRRPKEWRERLEHVGADGEKLAGDIYNILNVTVSPEEATSSYKELMDLTAEMVDEDEKK